MRFEVDEVLAADDRLVAVRLRFVAHDLHGGLAELPLGQVNLNEGGITRSVDQFDPDDREGMLRRYRELGGTVSVLGDLPPERLLAEVQRLLHGRDYESFAALVAEDWHWMDHRPVGWENARGRDACVALMRSTFDASPHLRVYFDEVLACDDRVIAVRQAWRGHGIKAGELEVEVGMVYVFEDERWVSADVYEPDDRRAMIARFAELGGGQGLLGERPPERFYRRWIPLAAASDADAVSQLVAEDFVRIDHRSLGWEPLYGREANLALWHSAYETAVDIRMEVDEVLACDDRVIALTFTWRGVASGAAGEFAASVGQVNVIEDGIWRSCDQYDTDDRDAMLARYRALSADIPEALRLGTELVAHWNTHDIDRAMQLYAENIDFVDHRSLGAEPLHGQAAVRELHRAAFEVIPDNVQELDEVLAADDRVVAFRVKIRGTSPDAAGGEGEIPIGGVDLFEDGKLVSVDLFEPDDRTAMMARYVELGGGLSKLGDTASERLFAEYTRRYTARDYDGVLAMMSEDYVQVDHRTLGWNEIGKEQNAAEIRSVWAGTTDIRPEVEEVLVADDRRLVCICTYRGSADASGGGGQFEYPVGFLLVTDGERASRVEWFDPDDREAMLARYQELSAPGDVTGPAARLIIRRCELCNSRQRDELRALYAEDYELIDHRPMPWEEVTGGDGLTALVDGMLEVSPDATVTLDLLDDDGGAVVAYRQTWSGTFEAAGLAEIVIDTVSVVRDGLIVHSELFEPGQDDQLQQRVAELRRSG
jgi:ketosteroid isomerase-like protein